MTCLVSRLVASSFNTLKCPTMSNYNSNLLFNTQVSYEDTNGAFETVDTSTNPFTTPQPEAPVVIHKISSPSAYPSVPQEYSQTKVPVAQPSQPTPHNSLNNMDINRMSTSVQGMNLNNSGNGINNSNRVNSTTMSSVPRSVIEISVKDPEKMGDSMNSYVKYKVVSVHHMTDRPDFKKEDEKYRRYSDFLWLRNVLKDTRRGVIIPPLPEKAIINKFNKEFIEQRRRELEKFLNRIAESESLVHSSEFTVFLTGDDQAMLQAKNSRPVNDMESSQIVSPPPQQENKGFGKISSFFSNTVNSVTNMQHSVKEVDPWFDDKKNYIQQLDTNLKKLEECVSLVIKKRKELAFALSEFTTAGLTFSSGEIAQSQDIANSFQRMTQVQLGVSKGMEELSNNEKGYFEDGIDDYVRVISAVKELINDRLDALLAVQNAERTLDSKKEKFEKGRGTAKADQLNREVEDASRKLSEAKSEFDRITATSKVELQRFDAKRNYEMKRIINYVIRLNLDHYLKASDLWRQFLTEQHQNGDPNFETNKASWGSSTI
ncbi:Phox domain-containing protein [Cavenderia fasciculata]|uniref:Phox domain-containing protein n=1 Tax=Cavenderia fasciculata TaxID=261658 RepID=F4Q7A1_CACFS|nr:Phox domain-containing protein [Cavenderia fasciculata]EGG16283.1 Phox domain-containing protein [Cavenderia fasciculata]|eukprot:XP_004354667.1 Phox domain-containing protein [Cavenderia fasciculata]